MSEYTIWWIDDNESRIEDSERLEDELNNATVQFTGPDKAIEQLNPEHENIEGLDELDLVLIDWKLHEKSKFPGKGLTMAGRVREVYPGVPIYGFSSEISALRAGAGDDQFEAIYEDSDLKGGDNAALIESDLEDYATIEAARGEGFEALIETLNPPEDAIEALRSVVPREYNNGLRSDPNVKGGSTIQFGRWIRSRFLQTPGPLIDNVWAATKIGLRPDQLEDYHDELNGTNRGEITYDGVFSHRVPDRWWSTSVIGAVVAIASDREAQFGKLNTFGRDVFEVDELPRCQVCGEELPETVAAGRDGRDAESQVHLRCSHVHHTREGEFEDYRIADKLEVSEETEEPPINPEQEGSN
ncbi:hypothetical protein C455_07977 [Haloferax larsenii JCM 13917]|nr:response regulator [Haloferax larsenii]ELZ79506.1 hypothetical protein C455_07977 [Haloferax larsenii JCM 13917]